MLLDGKIAIITGAATPEGIGRATARLFAAEGARVAMLDIDAEGLAESAGILGEFHRSYVCDVTDGAACKEVTGRIIAEFGGVDILVNNAGLVYGTSILDITTEEYDEVLDVNLRGNFHMAQATIPSMRRRGGGSIICMSSIAGQNGGGVFGRSHYAAAKAGIMGMAKALARELAPENIRVNAIAAGSLDNNFTKGRMTPEIKAKVAANVPMGRLGRPDEMAGVCLFLASEMSSYVTGAVIDANGGLLIH